MIPPSKVSVLLRGVALFVDLIPLAFFCVFLVSYLLNEQDAVTIEEVKSVSTQLLDASQAQALSNERLEEIIEGKENFIQFTEYAISYCFLLSVLYFSLIEIVLGGSTLGKMLFRITIAHNLRGYPAPVMAIISRNILKSFALFGGPWGVFLICDVAAYFFFPRKRFAHDWLSSTYAIYNNEADSLKPKDKPERNDFNDDEL